MAKPSALPDEPASSNLDEPGAACPALHFSDLCSVCSLLTIRPVSRSRLGVVHKLCSMVVSRSLCRLSEGQRKRNVGGMLSASFQLGGHEILHRLPSDPGLLIKMLQSSGAFLGLGGGGGGQNLPKNGRRRDQEHCLRILSGLTLWPEATSRSRCLPDVRILMCS